MTRTSIGSGPKASYILIPKSVGDWGQVRMTKTASGYSIGWSRGGSDGIAYEPDQRHVERIVQGTGLFSIDKIVNTFGVKPVVGKEEMDDLEPVSER